MCDEGSSKIQLCYKDTYYVLRFSHFSKLYNILWLWMLHIVRYWMKIGLLCLLYTLLISIYWGKKQWIKSTWRVVDNLQDMLLCFPRKVVICICLISLISLLANRLNVVGPLHKRVIDSFVNLVTIIIKCTWHEVHLSNHFSKFPYITIHFPLFGIVSQQQ
jgi:hypothetical protein